MGKIRLSTNSKLRKDGIVSWGLPSVKTCPQADSCKRFCYGLQGHYLFQNSRMHREHNLRAALSSSFSRDMMQALKKTRASVVRIHDTGDFFNRQYALAWCRVAHFVPGKHFYAYTKSVQLWKDFDRAGLVPVNLTIIFSYGGKQDRLINPKLDRHARVFNSIEELDRAGYTDCTKNDLLALETLKVGLVYHGVKKTKV